jgi:hypothetical protein
MVDWLPQTQSVTSDLYQWPLFPLTKELGWDSPNNLRTSYGHNFGRSTLLPKCKISEFELVKKIDLTYLPHLPIFTHF